MPTDLDTTNDMRTDAWHGMGQSIRHLTTATEALNEANLSGWNVRKMSMQVPIDDRGEDAVLAVPDRFATVRTNPLTGAAEYLGTVGKGYTVIQNEETAAFLDAVVDESGAHFDTAGQGRDGRDVYVTMELPDTMVLTAPGGDTDTTKFYLAALNSHDGGGAFRVLVTSVRMTCMNTQNAAVRNAPSSWSVRHTTNALKAIEEARQSLKITFAYIERFQDECDAMIAAAIDDDYARHVLADVFKVEGADTAAAEARRMGHVDRVFDLYTTSTTLNGTEGTRYGLYNATTEYVDHFWPRAGESVGVAPEKRVTGPYADLKSRAFSLLTVTG